MNSESNNIKEDECNNNKEETNNINSELKNENIEESETQDNLNNNKNNDISIENNIQENDIDIIPNKNFLNDYYKNEDIKIKTKKTKDGKSIINIDDLLGKKEEKIPITLEILQEYFENMPKNKISSRNFGIIKAYAANTSQGIIRDYNEDRVSIIINMLKPNNSLIDDMDWPKISYFGIFDGHAGNKCADYLKDNLIKKITNNNYFPKDIKNAIKFGFQSAEKDFLENYAVKNNKVIDKSGSCALILLSINNLLYIANVGDSRCVISCKNGRILKDVTRDHKPNYPYEKERIIKNKGNIYQSETPIEIDVEDEEDEIFKNKVILGPYRVNPGRLSVSRTIGDAEAKLSEFGGNPNVIICDPDIYIFDLEKDDVDFLVLGCDGIYDQLTSKEVLDCAWMVLNNISDNCNDNLNVNCGNIVDFILKMAMIRKSYDNVTCLIVAFKEIDEYRNKIQNGKNNLPINPIEIKEFFNKINNNQLKLNKTHEKEMQIKNRLPLLQLNINTNKTNNLRLKKKIKNNNIFFNYINKININLNSNNNRFKKKDANFTIRNISVPRQKKKLNRNSLTINKNDLFQINMNKDNSDLLMISHKIKKACDNPKNDNLTEPNNKNIFKSRFIEKTNNIITNSSKHNRIRSLNLKTNSFNSMNDEKNNNSLSIMMKKNIQTNYNLSENNKKKMVNFYPIENNNIKYHSVNKKNTILLDNNIINNNSYQVHNNNMCDIRLKSVENKIPLYQKAFNNTNILERNSNNNLYLNNNQLNILTYYKSPNIIKKDNRKILLNNIKNYPSIEDKNNNKKSEKPIKLKLDVINSLFQNNSNKTNINSKYNLSENNRIENKMPLINQRRIINNL